MHSKAAKSRQNFANNVINIAIAKRTDALYNKYK